MKSARKESMRCLKDVTVQTASPRFETNAYTDGKWGFLASQWQVTFISGLFHNTIDLKILTGPLFQLRCSGTGPVP